MTMGQSHYYWWHVTILLHGSKHHCTTEKPTRQPSLPASQLRTLLQNTCHITPNTKHQTSGFSQRQSIHPPSVSATHPHLAAATIHQLINKAYMNQWESWFGIWNNEDVIFCCFCGQLLWIWYLLSVYQVGVDQCCFEEEFSEHS